MKAKDITAGLAALGLALITLPAAGQGFSALVSPPRLELSAKPGALVREVLEITNASRSPSRFIVKTADWTLGPDAGVTFYDALQPGSCRPWVSIERKEISLAANARIRYRFEVATPAEATAGECRFAIMIEGDEPAVASGSAFQIPVRGRIGVIVYVRIGDAEPRLEIVKSEAATVDGRRVPAVWVKNTGNAHGRLGGFLSGVDARGRELDFSPSNFPILPGETRLITLAAQSDRNETVEVAFPVTVRGNLEWSRARIAFDQRFD
jgi:hypothetical protein